MEKKDLKGVKRRVETHVLRWNLPVAGPEAARRCSDWRRSPGWAGPCVRWIPPGSCSERQTEGASLVLLSPGLDAIIQKISVGASATFKWPSYDRVMTELSYDTLISAAVTPKGGRRKVKNDIHQAKCSDMIHYNELILKKYRCYPNKFKYNEKVVAFLQFNLKGKFDI